MHLTQTLTDPDIYFNLALINTGIEMLKFALKVSLSFDVTGGSKSP